LFKMGGGAKSLIGGEKKRPWKKGGAPRNPEKI